MPPLPEDNILHMTPFLPSERISAERDVEGGLFAYAPSFIDLGCIQNRAHGLAIAYSKRIGNPGDHFPQLYLDQVELMLRQSIRNVDKVIFTASGRVAILAHDDWGFYEHHFRMKLHWFE